MERRSICPTLLQRAGPSVSALTPARVTAGRVSMVAPACPALSMSFSASAETAMTVSQMWTWFYNHVAMRKKNNKKKNTGLAKGAGFLLAQSSETGVVYNKIINHL